MSIKNTTVTVRQRFPLFSLYMEGAENPACSVTLKTEKKNFCLPLFFWHKSVNLTNSRAFSPNKRLTEMLRGILAMWDGAQTGESDASDDAVS